MGEGKGKRKSEGEGSVRGEVKNVRCWASGKGERRFMGGSRY